MKISDIHIQQITRFITGGSCRDDMSWTCDSTCYMRTYFNVVVEQYGCGHTAVGCAKELMKIVRLDKFKELVS